MSNPLVIPCPHCNGLNRIPGERLGDAPKCGRCKQPVLPVYLASSVRMRESHQQNKPLIHLDPRHKLTQQFVELHNLLENA